MTEDQASVAFAPSGTPLTLMADSGTDDDSGGSWKILLVDDDLAIHHATQVALKFFTFEGKHLEFLSAYSGKEAQDLIAANPDTALILLDVIMETPNAGLQVAQYIRQNLRNHLVRIVLRTGHPGQVPEESAVLEYDINDYKTKLELTQQKLFTTFVSSLRSFRDLAALQQSQVTLSQLNQDLQDLNCNLERRVDERTAALKQKNQVLSHEIEERQRVEEALRVYIHALTHDLRNPVTGMGAVLSRLLRQSQLGALEAPQVNVPVLVLKRMQAGCDRQLNMIDSLIDAYRIDVWGMSLHRCPFSFGQMVEAVVVEWRPKFQTKRMSVEYDLDPALADYDGDRNQLWRVFENIFANVLKYNPPGIKIFVRVGVSADEPNVICCEITDTGIGIAPSQLNELFKLYQRAKPKPGSGLGIGLYICRQIIEAHGGKIWMTSQIGEGSQCCFLLPLA